MLNYLAYSYLLCILCVHVTLVFHLYKHQGILQQFCVLLSRFLY